MEPDTLKDYEKACAIAADSLMYGKKLIVKGASLLEVTEKIEDYIISKGGMIAFPAQMSFNSTAAHFYPDHEDKTIFSDQLVKLDVGVHVNGCIGDNALTVDLSGEYGELVKASEQALANAIKIVKAGVTTGEIGKVIQETITSYGFAPVRNLSGHGLGHYDIHCWPSIPNTDTGDDTVLEAGQVIAIEPFASTGAGIVSDTTNPQLFALIAPKPVRDPSTLAVLKFIMKNYETLPFAKRWLIKEFPEFKVNLALRNMMQTEMITEFTPLVDRNKGMVSQAEHTLLVEEHGCRILTKRD